ncbi:hypothetical protein PHLCEN_2v9033 [Hermanssonia centrifuga]|uniref:F-box domain-containing protein n=1 Tax=Hermanssonia centrifuga TaxID=98765 RepID=A0A2R6NSL4_9APHY|nr:hypothetical protein PHLCEN_2v9033 [Hermanssonia centrifuga]
MDSLRDDRAALQACSLTCRSWLPRARHHLFRHIHIDPGPRGIAFRKLIDTNPEIGRHVNDLQISGFVLDKVSPAEVSGNWPTLALPQPNASPRNRGHSSDTTLDHILPKSIDALSGVSSLRLSALSISKELADLLHKYFSAVKTVILTGCRAGAFRDFCYLPRAFSQTECLHIIDAQWLRTVLPPTAETLPGRPPTLKSLVLSRKVDSTTVVIPVPLQSGTYCSPSAALYNI